MKKILVPCDFSEQSIEAFRFAVDVCKQSKGEVHLLNVVELPIMYDTVIMPTVSFEEALLNEFQDKSEKELSKMVKKYAKEMKKVIPGVKFGATSFMILEYIKENNIDVVVMGSQGASGVKEALIGSNAEKIVRRSPVPVLIIKKFIRASSIKNIVFPNTLEQDQEDLTMKVKALQSFFKAKIHIVFINTPSNFTRDVKTIKRLKDFVKRFMIKDFTINVYNDSYEESGVINFAHSINADLVAMGTHGRIGINHFLGGSVAEDIVNHIDCPIWTYTIKK